MRLIGFLDLEYVTSVVVNMVGGRNEHTAYFFRIKRTTSNIRENN